MGATDIIAFYAAVVSTAVALFEFWKWKRSGARFRLNVMVPAKIYGGGEDNNEYLHLTVTNIGDAATTVTHMGASSLSESPSNES